MMPSRLFAALQPSQCSNPRTSSQVRSPFSIPWGLVSSTLSDVGFSPSTDMTRAIEGLQSSFDSEMKAKDAVLSAASSQLIDTTRDLAAERKQAQTLELKMWELDQVGQRIKNLEKALEQENGFDWTGRASLPSDTKAGPSFVSRPRSSSVAPPTFSGPDPTVASDLNADPGKEIYEMRKITWWQKRVHELLKERISSVKEDSSEKELLYTKVIALCSGVPAEMVEEVRFITFSGCWTGPDLLHPVLNFRCSTNSLSQSRVMEERWTAPRSTDLRTRCVRSLSVAFEAYRADVLSPIIKGSRTTGMSPFCGFLSLISCHPSSYDHVRPGL